MPGKVGATAKRWEQLQTTLMTTGAISVEIWVIVSEGAQWMFGKSVFQAEGTAEVNVWRQERGGRVQGAGANSRDNWEGQNGHESGWVLWATRAPASAQCPAWLVSPKIHTHTEPQDVTSFGSMVFADVLSSVKISSYWIRMSLNPVTSVPIRRPHKDTDADSPGKTEAMKHQR